ncbi:MAG: RagB/SusD family nutrient uptake outer membrane protein [Chitinophagales bacterium]|nr:RagB/SusD family nutrient uptake outer membrane protein [Chitinophagales bacterium]
MKQLRFLIILSLSLAVFGCTSLEEELNDGVSQAAEGEIDIAQLLNGAYGNLRDLQSQDNLGALVLHSTDELAGPTRGRDWDDAGIWRTLHTHSWTTAHAFVNSVWRTLNRNAFSAQTVLCSGATGTDAAEATFLRVFNDFMILDLYGKIPRRACGEDLLEPPSQLLTRENAAAVLISELEGVMGDLPEGTSSARASKNAARALLAKLYLNKAVYAATTGDGGAQEGPYSFDESDMNQVIAMADAITASGEYELDDNYFDSFIPNNGEASSELIFVSENTSGAASGNVRSRWFMTTHYNQTPSGWNGFVALTDLYNLFEEDDMRRQQELDFMKADGIGYNAGFLVGQQYDADGNPLEDRAGNPLAFTSEFNLRESGDNLEVTGIRAIKYPTDISTPGDASDNDYVFLRYADVILMKAEALFRSGKEGDGLTMINNLRMLRGASELSSLTEQDILDERGRELYWEGWRRNDQIRFNSFLGTWQAKSNPSEVSRLLFPIPAEAISTDPNLPQNPGY